MALGGLGEIPVGSTTETKFSRLADALFDAALEEVLRAHPWNFAVKRAVLAPGATLPVSGYAASFPLPPDCLRILDAGEDSWRVEGRAILADAAAISLRYVARPTDSTLWDASFVAALVANLMWKLTYPVTKSTTLRDSNFAAYSQLLQQARSIDAQEEPAEELEESSLIAVRGR